MTRLAVSIIFFASLAIGFAFWLVFDRLFVRRQNQLLSRFDKTDAIEAAVLFHSDGWPTKSRKQMARRLASWLGFEGFSKAQRSQLFELPDLIDLLAVALSSGESLYGALLRVAAVSNGVVARDLNRVVLGVQLGSSLSTELAVWSERAKSRQVAELCAKLQLALQRGTPLAEMLTDQAGALRAEAQQLITKKAGQNETRMLVPLVFLILPVTVLFAIYPSLQVLSIAS